MNASSTCGSSFRKFSIIALYRYEPTMPVISILQVYVNFYLAVDLIIYHQNGYM